MEDILFEIGEVLYADPNQVKIYHAPIETEYGNISIEDNSTTRWLNKEGKLARVGEPDYPKVEIPTESYSFQIIDFSDGDK